MKSAAALVMASLGLLALAGPTHAYVDWAPTLGKLIKDSSNIIVVQVEKVSQEKRAIIYRKIADLKGQSGADEIKHAITDGLHPREPATIMHWAEPGQTAILFQNRANVVVCIGRYWYEAAGQEPPWWAMTSARPELALSYYGSVLKLREHLAAILAGKEVEVTAIRFGKPGHGGSREMRMAVVYRNTLRGGTENPIWRLRVSLKMPDFAYMFIDDPKVQVGAVSDPKEVPGLIKQLQGAEISVRIDAALQLADMGTVAREAAPALTEALADKSASLRRVAAGALGDVAGEAAVPALIRALRDADAMVRWQAADALARIGPKAHPAVPALMEALKDKDPSMRGIAADALGGIDAYARAAIPALQQVIVKDADRSVRLTAGAALIRIDPTVAKAAMPLFFDELRKTTDTRIRLNYLTYLHRATHSGYWGEKDWVPTLLDIMRTDEFWVDRISAVYFLAGMTRSSPSMAETALPGILESLHRDPDPNNRFEVARLLADPAILKHVGGHKAALAQALTDALKDKEPGVRIESAKSLQALGPEARIAVKELTAALKDAHPGVRTAADEALKAIGSR